VSTSTSVFASHTSAPCFRHASKSGAHARTTRPSGTRAYSKLPKLRATTPCSAAAVAAAAPAVASALNFRLAFHKYRAFPRSVYHAKAHSFMLQFKNIRYARR
jgi:hypothetical protein